MGISRKWFFLLLAAAVLVLGLLGCAPGEQAEPVKGNEVPEQPGLARPSPDDPGSYAYILIPDFWEQGVLLEGNRSLGYLLAGFNVPAGTLLYAPFDGVTGAVTLEDYGGKSGSCEGRSLCAPDSLNGFSAYNVTGTVEGAVKAGDVFAEVSSEQYVFQKYYGKVNLVLEFNLFDSEAASHAEMQALFGKIYDHLLEGVKGTP